MIAAVKDLPSRWFYATLLAALAGVLVCAYVVNVAVATYVLAGLMIGLAGLRATCGPRVIPHVRATWFDVLCLLVVAAVLIYLAPWGLSPMLN